MEVSEVNDREAFVRYVAQLRAEVESPLPEGELENIELCSFLEAMGAWAESWSKPFDDNPWRHAADLLTAALVYE